MRTGPDSGAAECAYAGCFIESSRGTGPTKLRQPAQAWCQCLAMDFEPVPESKGGHMSEHDHSTPDDDPQVYRLITGPDDQEFCKRVSAALDEGYVLYGSPSITADGGERFVAQAVVLADPR